ncbi:MAG: DUF4139 domain-containing protein [Phycisphaerales bacterium]|nr:DUF4139 domain-containing protein [Phycisphaerales bacterium]
MSPGVYQLVFTDLPVRWQPASVQAKVSGGAKVVGIDTATRQVSTPPSNLEALAETVKAAERAVQSAADALAVRDASIAFIRTMMTKASEDDRDKAGTAGLSIDDVQSQLKFFSAEMATLLAARQTEAEALEDRNRELEIAKSELSKAGGSTRTQRDATVELAVTSAGEIEVTLGYLVSNANWSPRYDVRGDLDAGTVVVDYGASIVQRTGEDWNDVTLVLSTAQPAQSANPPTINPVYVDVYVPPPPPPPVGRRSRGPASPAPEMALADSAVAGASGYYASDAQVSGGGSSVTFTLPRRVTVETNSESAQRTRIADFQAEVDFTFVAMPVLTEQVYLRGRFMNSSDYQLLAGEAGIFMGGDYVGPTVLGAAAPGSKIELYFGADPAIEATRNMLTKNTGETGVFGGWLKTSYQFVLAVSNGTSRDIKLELWDRRPISRSDEIEVSVSNLTRALSTNASYVADDLPKGLMRWDLTVPAQSTGDRVFKISYDLDIERKEGVDMTPLPD